MQGYSDNRYCLRVGGHRIIYCMVLAWDSDFTKLTLAERQRLELAEQEIEAGETVSHDEIDWN